MYKLEAILKENSHLRLQDYISPQRLTWRELFLLADPAFPFEFCTH